MVHGTWTMFHLRTAILLNPSSLWWTAPIVRYGCRVSYRPHFQTCGLQRTNRRIAPRPRSFDIDFQTPHSRFARTVGRRQGRLLCRKRSPFSRPFEAECAGARPTHDITFHVGDRHRGVIKGRLNMRDSCRDDSLFFLLCTLLLGLSHYLLL